VKDAHKLKCRYVHNNHPLLLLQPVKEEEMHLDPLLVLYHDMLSDQEISDIKMLATPRVCTPTCKDYKF
jgi:prolyl 4-hydroxylase